MRRIAVGIGIALALTVAAPAAAATRTPSAYETELFRALATCQTRTQDTALLNRCVRDLAAPDTTVPFEIDLFRTFTYCLWLAADGDSMYPGVHPNEVNNCLEDFGF